jgi:FkbM family methyltransferase
MKLKNVLRTVYYWARGKKTSYSQVGEDLICDFFLGKRKTGFYVDVGANDPIHLSNSYYFYKKGWQGICVEPNPQRSKLFKIVRPRDVVLNMGVGSTEGSLDYFVFQPDTVSTFNEDEAKEFVKLGHKLVKTQKIYVNSLANILEKNLPKKANIDILSSDTEGFDLKVLQGNDWQKFRPKLVVVETAKYRGGYLERDNKDFDQLMASKEYLKLADTYINGIYIEKKFADSTKIFGI